MLTIITACYNGVSGIGEDAVRRCIMSVSALPFPHEHLIMDGASSDGSVDFIKGLNVPSLQIYSEKDSGIYDALNKGLAKAKGDYIYVLGLDDYIEHPAAMAQVYGMVKYGYDIVCSPVKDANGFFPSSEACLSMLYYRMPISHQGMLVRRSILITQGGYDVSYKIIADCKHLLTSALQGCRIKYVPVQYAVFGLQGVSAIDEGSVRKEFRKLYGEFYPLGDVNSIANGFLPFVYILRLIFCGKSLFVRCMGLKAFKCRLYTKIKTDEYSVRYVFGVQIKKKRKEVG